MEYLRNIRKRITGGRMKEEALKLADELDALHQYVPSEAPAMIRRLVEELDYLKNQISFYELKDLGNQTKPLSDEEILKFIHEKFVMFGFEADYIVDDNELIEFARTIEERHRIK